MPASRKLSGKEAAALVQGASRVVVIKGKKVMNWKPGGTAAKDCVAAMLGPTGNLRAPTLRSGKTVLVGFNEEVFTSFFD